MVCGGSHAAATQGGEFQAKVSGAATASLKGFAPSTGRPGVGWTLQMETPGAGNVIMIVREGAGRPDPGTYTLVDAATRLRSPAAGHLVASVLLHDSILPGPGFDTVRGTLTVTDSSDTSVHGTFTITARNSKSPSHGVTVTGSFKSRNTPM
jgi:hypothetical protein